MGTTVKHATVAICLVLFAVTAGAVQPIECCVCEADCPAVGDRVCFNVGSQGDCENACEAAGCRPEMAVCIPGVACVEVGLCAETGEVPCSDGLDNNSNGLIDCQEPSCKASKVCLVPAPAMSRRVAFALTLLLVLGGMSMLRRRSRRV